MDVSLGHHIFGHRSVTSLLQNSELEVWEDGKMVEMSDN